MWQWRGFALPSIMIVVIFGAALSAHAAQANKGESVGSQLPQGAHLVGYWPFNGNALDESGHHNDGVVVGASLTTDRFGNPDSAYLFDGVDDRIRIKDSLSLKIGTSDYSIVAWIKPIEPTNNGRMFSKGSWNCTTGYMMRLDGNVVRLESANGSSCLVALDGATVVTDGAWHLVVGVVDRDVGAKIYVDCSLDASQSIDTSSVDLSNDRNPRIGLDDGWRYATDEFFDGSIDDVRVYTRVLTSRQVRALYDLNGGC